MQETNHFIYAVVEYWKHIPCGAEPAIELEKQEQKLQYNLFHKAAVEYTKFSFSPKNIKWISD
jgi:hypothetical protein